VPGERGAARVGYVVKRYPRYSETFVVSEILAQEAAGRAVDIFSLYPVNDTHFQDAIARVRAPLTYLCADGLRAADLWSALEQAAAAFPNTWGDLRHARGYDARSVYQAARLAVAVRERGVEHLHAHFATVAAAVARLAARVAGISYSVTAHAKDIFQESVDARALRRTLADAAAVVTVSDYNRAYLCDACALPPEAVHRVYNGLDLDRFPYAPPYDRAPTVVAVGRLVEKKGFADLVDACAILAARGVAFTCGVIGAGPLEGALRAQIEGLGLERTVSLLGPLPQPAVATAVRDAAAFVAPCVVAADGDRDGLPTVLLEAMALGTPCVSTDVTGVPEVLRDGVTGLCVPQHAPERIATAVERLLADRVLRVRLAERARRLIEEEFDVRRNAARLGDVFDAAIARAGPRRSPALAEAW
jgi:colanic acid/amylovoran biosynthesis glycosyltransferase